VNNKNSRYPLNIRYNTKYIEEAVNSEFLGLKIDNHLKCESHIDQLVSRLSVACYAVRFMFWLCGQGLDYLAENHSYHLNMVCSCE
jgi:hypothetical protein